MVAEAAVQTETPMAYWRTYAARHQREDADARDEARAMGHVAKPLCEDAPREAGE